MGTRTENGSDADSACPVTGRQQDEVPRLTIAAEKLVNRARREGKRQGSRVAVKVATVKALLEALGEWDAPALTLVKVWDWDVLSCSNVAVVFR